MSTSAEVARYEHEARRIPGLPESIEYLPDDPAVTSGVYARLENGVGIIQGAPSYTVTRRIALHELGHLWHFAHRDRQDAFWAARFGACGTAPATWAEAYADAHRDGTEVWMVLPGETIAECFAVAVDGSGKERTLDYGCTVKPAEMRAFFGYAAPPPAGVGTTVDIRSLLPFEGNVYGTFAPKDSLTFHWNGGPVPDGDPVDILKADAVYHIDKGWGGISYHGAIWTDGTLYITRDADAVLAACGNAIGNARSRHVQVMVGAGQVPSDAQWSRMAELASAETSVYPHKYWSATRCPGEEIEAWIAERGWDEMTPAQEAKLDRVLAILEAREPLVWSARQQRFLDVETGKAYDPNKPPQDPRIKVT